MIFIHNYVSKIETQIIIKTIQVIKLISLFRYNFNPMKLLKLSSIALASLAIVTSALSTTSAIQPNPTNILLGQSQVSKSALQKLVDVAIKDARKHWGLDNNSVKVLDTKPIKWSPDCGYIPLALCDVAVASGYQITLASSNRQWTYFVSHKADIVSLIARTPQNLTSTKLPKTVINNVLNMASKHLELRPDALVIKQVERKQWVNMCLVRAFPNESCLASTKENGYRIVIEGKDGKNYVYLTSESGNEVRTQATKIINSRDDLLPNRWANSLIVNASNRLKIPSQQLFITHAKQQNINSYAWEVKIVSPQGCQINYELDFGGNITKSSPINLCKS